MPNEKQLSDFLTKIIPQLYADLNLYKNPPFCSALRKRALEDIESILFHIHNSQLKHSAAGRTFCLRDAISMRHHATQFTILDYCIIAGLDDIALRVASLGCETKVNLNQLQEKLSECFVEDEPEIIDNIHHTLRNTYTAQINNEGSFNQPLSIFEQFKQYLDTHKYPALLLLAGISCMAASPFSGGLSTILLLSLGIPSAMASFPAFQAASAAKKSREQLAEQARTQTESNELKDLINLTHSYLHNKSEIVIKNTEDEKLDTVLDIKRKLYFSNLPEPEVIKVDKRLHRLYRLVRIFYDD